MAKRNWQLGSFESGSAKLEAERQLSVELTAILPTPAWEMRLKATKKAGTYVLERRSTGRVAKTMPSRKTASWSFTIRDRSLDAQRTILIKTSDGVKTLPLLRVVKKMR